MSPEPRLDEVFVRSDRMVGRRIADEYILVPIVGRGAEVDAIYNLNRVGAFIWEHLDGRSDGDTVVQALVARFAVERERAVGDYRDFIAKLMSVNAVRREVDGAR
jgi:hypothetical protein